VPGGISSFTRVGAYLAGREDELGKGADRSRPRHKSQRLAEPWGPQVPYRHVPWLTRFHRLIFTPLFETNQFQLGCGRAGLRPGAAEK
jgi:hypothetical protein